MLFEGKKRPLIMGILNITPDSFSGDGLMASQDYVTAATKLAAQMVSDGADILDIGGESTRPGATPVNAEDEITRIIPVIKAICESGITTPISIDTTKAQVAEAALEAGANIINDVSALAADNAMANFAAKSGMHLILMHNRSKAEDVTSDTKIGGQYRAPHYTDILFDVKRDLAASADKALKAGVAKDKIIIDPGIGFGKTVEQNLELINNLDTFKALGYPLMIGASRKSFIGKVLDTGVDERLEGTAATTVIATLKGADIIRVHDVKFMARVVLMTTKIASV